MPNDRTLHVIVRLIITSSNTYLIFHSTNLKQFFSKQTITAYEKGARKEVKIYMYNRYKSNQSIGLKKK